MDRGNKGGFGESWGLWVWNSGFVGGWWMILITVWITEVVLVVGETVRSKLLGLEF